MTLDLDVQSKVKVPRETFVHWVEAAFKKFQDGQRMKIDIRRVFQHCGLDPYNDDPKPFEDHLASLQQEAIYQALTESQKAVNLI